MVGHEVTPINLSDDQRKRLCCPSCGLLLRKAQQDETSGICYCRSSCSASSSQFWPDKAIDREIHDVIVRCEFGDRDCHWEGCLTSFYEDHQGPCLKAFHKKETADLQKKIYDLEQQLDQGQKVLMAFSSNSEPKGESLRCIHPAAQIIKIKRSFSLESEESQSCCSATTPPSKRPNSPPLSSYEADDDIIANCEKGLSNLEDMQKEMAGRMDNIDAGLKLQGKRVEACAKVISLSGSWNGLPREKSKTFQFVDYSEGKGPPNGSPMQCRWRVSNVSELITEAISHPNTPLVSPPWHTQQSGYRMQAFLFPNGYGRFSGTHVSIFMSVIHGPDDDFLKWPLNGIPTFFLLDPKGKNARLHVKTCRSDPQCDAFRQKMPSHKDTSDDIVAAGFSDFIPIETLTTKYTKENTMFLELALPST